MKLIFIHMMLSWHEFRIMLNVKYVLLFYSCSGGRLLTVSGSNLMSIQKPKLFIGNPFDGRTSNLEVNNLRNKDFLDNRTSKLTLFYQTR